MDTSKIYDKEAKDKIKEIAKKIDFTMMATNLNQIPFFAIPMSTKKVDSNGNIWFLSGRDSEHNSYINNDKRTQLIYSKPGDHTYMILYGSAVIVHDKSVLEDLYSATDDNWFNGVDDPNLSAIKFSPIEAHCWEPKYNKLVTLFKMGIGAITGEQPEIGEQTHLKV